MRVLDKDKEKMKNLLVVLLTIILSGCNLRGETSTGPTGEVYEISLTVNAKNEVHLSGEVAIPTPLRSKLVEVNWLVAFDKAFNKAQQTENTLFVLYEDDFGSIVQDVYDMQHLFKLSFTRHEWVRKIHNAGDGSLVVFVDRLQDHSQLREKFEISGCSSSLECPDTISAISLLGEDTSVNFDHYYRASISSADNIHFLVGWCTNDRSLLDQNLEHIEFVFNVNSHSYADSLEGQYQSQPGADNSKETEYCYLEGAIIKNWDYGTYDVQFGFRIKAEIHDGWENYSPQDYIRYYTLDAG